MAQVEKIVVTLKQSVYGLDETHANNVKFYPNPTPGNLFVTLPENYGKEVTIRITNLNGTVLLENKVAGSNGKIRLDLSGYDDGVYFITIGGVFPLFF